MGICRHSFGAKRQRTVASACRSRYPLAPQVGKVGAEARQSKGSGLIGYHVQEGFSPKYYGVLAAKELVLQRDPGTRARAGGLGTLLGSDCVRFHEPITSSLRPSVLTTHEEGMVSNAACICEPETQVTALLSDHYAGSSRKDPEEFNTET